MGDEPMPRARALLFGAAGMLGRDLVRQTPPGFEVVAHVRSDTDVTDPAQLERAIRDARPEVVVNAAAYTAVDRAESEPEQARAVNAEAPGLIGKAAVSLGARLVVHFSTDYVFDGTAGRPYREADPAHPICTYGRTKLAGERALAASGVAHLIIRTSWLFGLHGQSFPRTMWERARAGEPTRVVDDQTGKPTYTLDLAGRVWTLLDRTCRRRTIPPSGLLHVANSGTATWYDIARWIFAVVSNEDLLTPCATADSPMPARRPPCSVLETKEADRLLGPMPPWADALGRFLTALEGDSS